MMKMMTKTNWFSVQRRKILVHDAVKVQKDYKAFTRRAEDFTGVAFKKHICIEGGNYGDWSFFKKIRLLKCYGALHPLFENSFCLGSTSSLRGI